jgi:hypothetical protein
MQGKVNQSEGVVEYLPPKDALANAPTTYTPITFGGGPVISAPELVSFYWGAFSDADINQMQAWLQGFAGFLAGVGAPVGNEPVTQQYGTYGATLGSQSADGNAPATATEADVKAKILALQSAGAMPAFSPERLFLVFTTGVSFSGYGTAWCAYHGSWGTGQYFAIIPYPSSGGCGSSTPSASWQSVTSHEIMEAITDAVVGQGWNSSSGEGGDICAWQEVSMPFGTMQRFADNLQQACSNWSIEERISVSVAAWSANRLDIIAKGTDGGVYHKAWDGSQWTPSATTYESLGGLILGAPIVVSWGQNRLDIFVKGTDGALYHKSWTGTEWYPSMTDWESLGGLIIGSPEVVSWGANRLDIFAQGTDGAMYHKAWNGSAWVPSMTGWESLGGVIVGPPVAVSWSANRLDIFARGTDLAMYHKSYDGNSWSPSMTGYESLGGTLTSAPAAVSWGPNRLDIFARGTDGGLYHKWWDGSSWGGWEGLGGAIVGAPSPVAWGANRLDVFVRDVSGALFHKWWDGSSWGPSATTLENLGGVLIGAPVAVSWGPNRLDVLGEGTDGALYHKYWNGSAWAPSGSSWESLGGVLGATGAAAGLMKTAGS